MSQSMTRSDEAQDDEYTPQYGDRFKNIVTFEERTVQDVRNETVTFVEGGWEDVDELRAAVNDETSMFEPVAVGNDVYEGDGY